MWQLLCFAAWQREALGITPNSGTVLQKPELGASWFGPHSQPSGVQDGTEKDRVRVWSPTSHVTRSFGPDATGLPASSVPWVPRGLGVPQRDSISVTVVFPTKDMFSNVSDPQGNLLVCNKPRGTQCKMTDGPRACRLWLLVSLEAEVSS